MAPGQQRYLFTALARPTPMQRPSPLDAPITTVFDIVSRSSRPVMAFSSKENIPHAPT